MVVCKVIDRNIYLPVSDNGQLTWQNRGPAEKYDEIKFEITNGTAYAAIKGIKYKKTTYEGPRDALLMSRYHVPGTSINDICEGILMLAATTGQTMAPADRPRLIYEAMFSKSLTDMI